MREQRHKIIRLIHENVHDHKMKKTIIVTAFLLAASMLLAGCTSSNDSGEQNNGIQQDAAPAGSDQPQEQGFQDNGNRQAQGRGMGAPRGGMEAQFTEACSGKAVGDACTLNFRNQSVDGTCTDQEGNVTCRPIGGSVAEGPGMPGGRNEAFIQACSGKAAGDPCVVPMRNETTEGTCAERSGNMSCVPNNIGGGSPRAGSPPGNR